MSGLTQTLYANSATRTTRKTTVRACRMSIKRLLDCLGSPSSKRHRRLVPGPDQREARSSGGEHSRRVGIHDQLPEGGSNGSGARSGKQILHIPGCTWPWLHSSSPPHPLLPSRFGKRRRCAHKANNTQAELDKLCGTSRSPEPPRLFSRLNFTGRPSWAKARAFSSTGRPRPGLPANLTGRARR